MAITNETLKDYAFLQDMYEDDYFPTFLVDKTKQILVNLCETIEAQKPVKNEALLELTEVATEEINVLAEEFLENDSEIVATARETICGDFVAIASAYGFDIDDEDLTAGRSW